MKKAPHSPSRPSRPRPSATDATEVVLQACEHISAMAELLEACDVDAVNPRSVNCIGFLIAEQARRLKGEF